MNSVLCHARKLELIQFFRGRGLSYQLVNDTEGGPAYTWSSIASTKNFADGKMPMPIIVTLERAPREQYIGKAIDTFTEQLLVGLGVHC